MFSFFQGFRVNIRRCIPPVTGKSKTDDQVPAKHVETSTQKFQPNGGFLVHFLNVVRSDLRPSDTFLGGSNLSLEKKTNFQQEA